ncbi:hypothetical protein FRC09_012438 [Ceratobasidium sp. 395]|nr:hypothetical protein FRC09_012438 [Ceratobasidium sp. 395]
MSSKVSSRVKARKFLRDSGQALRDFFRPRSPAPSSLSAVQSDQGDPTPSTAGPTSNVTQSFPRDELVVDGNVTASVAILGQSSTSLPAPVSTPTLKPSAIESLENPDNPALDNSTTNVKQSPFAPSSAPLATTQSPLPGVGQSSSSSQGVIATGIPFNSDVVLHAPQPAQSPVLTTSGDQVRDTTSAILKASLNALGKCVGVVPTFKSIVDILADCVGNIPAAAKNHKDYKALAEDIKSTIESLQVHIEQANSTHMFESIENVMGALTEVVDHIKQKQTRTTARTYVEAEQDVDDLMSLYRRVDTLLRQLHSDSILSIWRITNKNFIVANEILADNRLKGLNPVLMASYDSSAASQLGRGSCTPNTRLAVIERLQNWASDPNGAKIYWMNGMAGTGKTTIAYSFCDRLKASHQLAASFFCSRSLPDCRDEARILPTIAYQLARTVRPFQDMLCRVLSEDPDAGARNAATQFEKLLRDPLLQSKDQIPVGLLVIVIDALDECSSPTITLSVLNILLRFANDLPVKFFVTCRPEHRMLDQVELHEGVSRSLYHLHDIEQSLVQADIETYIQVELGPLNLPEDSIKLLIVRSGKLFIYAATAARYIKAQSDLDDYDSLQVILQANTSMSGEAHESLDALYTAILSGALESKGLRQGHKEKIKLVLDTVVCAREPLAIQDIARLLQLASSKQAERAIEPLRSVLQVEKRSGVVSTLHASFPNYMLTSSRSGRFCCDEVKHNQVLAQRCFETMNDLLQFNICNLESSFMLDRQLLDLGDRIERSVQPHLYYVCHYWSDHTIRGGSSSTLHPVVQRFLFQQALFWVEVMSLKNATSRGAMMLADAYRWMKGSRMPDDCCLACQDTQKFTTIVGASPVRKSTPHIYVSILALWDKADPVWLHYGARIQNLVRATGTAIDNRELAGLAAWQYKQAVFSVSASPDGRLVASGSAGDNGVCVWDVHTGQVVAGPLKGHTGHVYSVAFSSDGGKVASGSKDNTIRIWNAKTGQLVAGPFEGHTGSVRSVVFSPDDSHIASGSHDFTVRIWDAKTGLTTKTPCSGHTSWVISVVYSPDGESIASGSEDCSIRMWNAQNGEPRLGPLKGHTDAVYSVMYSPTGDHIVSGSADRTVRIWDSHSGDLIAGPLEGHTDVIHSVAYSPDGAYIVSGSHDHTIRIWDAHTGQTVAGPLRGHTDEVYAAVYMPDGNRIVSCSSDQTIRIWDARTRHTRSSLSEGHTAGVQSVAFSPDGSRIVSGSNDCTVCIWDVRTGARLVGPLKGHTSDVNSVMFSPRGDRVASASSDQTIWSWDAHTGVRLTGPIGGEIGEVNCVMFSPDGDYLASGSDDCTVRVWDLLSGSQVAGPFKGHSYTVMSVAYSPDGKCIVSSSCDHTLRIWDIQAGTMLDNPLTGHTQQVNSVQYSLDGRRIVSGSNDHTIRIWDARTRHTIYGPLTGHSDFVWSVTYSPDRRYIVSGSNDNTLRIWDAETGQPMVGPFRAHTHWVKSVTFSPDSRLVASSSHDSTIRVWDAQKCLATPQDPDYWTMNEDGWVVGHDSSLLFWVPADLRPMLKWPQNTALINQQGSFELDFTDAALGPRWTECWKSE